MPIEKYPIAIYIYIHNKIGTILPINGNLHQSAQVFANGTSTSTTSNIGNAIINDPYLDGLYNPWITLAFLTFMLYYI